MCSVTWNAKSVRPLPPIALPALKMGLMNLFWMGVRVLLLQHVHQQLTLRFLRTYASHVIQLYFVLNVLQYQLIVLLV